MPQTVSTLDRLLDPVAECLTPEVARRIAEVQADPQTLERLEELRRKANQGTLSEAERAEYAEFVEGLDLLSILKSKARARLEKQAS
jgi:hypothetical protein